MELFGGPGFDVFGNDFIPSADGIHEETNSSAELDSLSSDDFMEETNSNNVENMEQKMAQTLRRCSLKDFREISWQNKETQNEMSNAQNEISTTQNGRELNASVFLTGEQICSGEFNGIKEDFEANEGEIRAEASSCNAKGFGDVFRVVGPDGFQSVRNNEEVDEGIHLSQEVAVEYNAATMKNSESCDSDKLERPDRSDVDANCVSDSAKFVALLIENLLQFPNLLKEWASKTLAKAKAIPTFTEKGVEMNVIGEFAPECASTRDQQNGREKNYSEDLVGALGFPLGMSIATVLAEIMTSNNCLKESISADDMSELLGSAIRESLNKVLGSGCNRLVKDFEVAFTSTFKMIKQVKQVQYQKKITSYPTEKKMPNSDGQTSGLATVGFADLKEEYANFLPNLQGKIPEKTDWSQDVEQIPSTSNPKQGIEMKGENQQSCKPSFIQSVVQVTEKPEDECHVENCRVDCEFTSCISETVSVKDCNVLTCQNSSLVNQHDGGVAPYHREIGFPNPQIEDIIQKLKNIKLESAYNKNISIGIIPSVSSDRLASTARSFEECDSNLASASYENDITYNVSTSHHNPLDVLHGDSQRQLAKKTVSSIVTHTEWPQSISQVFERSLIEQKRCNNLRELEIGISFKQLQLKEAKMSVAAESNELQRQNISINQHITSFKESKFIDQKLNSAYAELNRTCADHLVAGLVLMLFALAYGSWKYSYSHFSNEFEMCRAITKEQQKSSWFYNPMDSITTHFQTLSCQLIVIGRMLFGWAIIAFSATSLLRRTVASSSQAMPTTIIFIVLGLVCGYAGKLSVDNVGGNGFRWLVHWEALCFLHALSACFPAFLLRILNGPASSYEHVQEKACLIPLGIRKFFFHMFLLVLPVMAGLAPFASLREWTKHFSLVISDNVVEPVRISVTDYFGQFMGV